MIPALRKELALALKGYGLSQKKIAQTLQVSPAAISQYVKEKRAKSVPFNSKTKALIKESASVLTYSPKSFTRELVKLTQMIRDSKAICRIHELFDDSIRPNCNDCFAGVEDE